MYVHKYWNFTRSHSYKMAHLNEEGGSARRMLLQVIVISGLKKMGGVEGGVPK